MDGGHGAERGVHRRQVVGGGQRHTGWGPVGIAGHVAHTANGLADGAVTRALGVGPGLAVAADAHHHQTGIARRERLIAQTQALHHAGAVVFHQDVGARDQLEGQFTSGGGFQVQDHGALVAQDGRRIQRDVADMLTHLAHRVALRGFDLDHVGAEIGQQARAGRAGDGGADLDDLQAGQRPGGGCVVHGLSPEGPTRPSCRMASSPDSSMRWCVSATMRSMSPCASAVVASRHRRAERWRRSTEARPSLL